MERGKLLRALQGFALSRPCVLDVSNEIELLVEMLTKIDGKTKDEWIDIRAIIVKVEGHRFLIHFKSS